jgi:hypothetical protein
VHPDESGRFVAADIIKNNSYSSLKMRLIAIGSDEKCLA